MKFDTPAPITHKVILRRANGRYVKEFGVTSKYAANKKKRGLEAAYDESYYVDIEPVGKGGDAGAEPQLDLTKS